MSLLLHFFKKLLPALADNSDVCHLIVYSLAVMLAMK